ncbi:hypothetical protein N9301_09185 [Paracoccaceae bacterium]|jgi:hypothetical protein|nr:hypothetical protein [Paracoccaceae bacterium]
MNFAKFACLLAAGTLVFSCAPREYISTGIVGSKKYFLKVRHEDEGLKTTKIVQINDKEVFRQKVINLYNDPACKKTSTFAWLCTYTASYQGAPVIIEQGITSTASGMNNWYDVYINDELIQRVPVS